MSDVFASSTDENIGKASAKATTQAIRVAPAVLDASHQEAAAVLSNLQTALTGLTAAEAEERRRTIGPMKSPGSAHKGGRSEC